jgi:hypothetical protein
LRRLDHLIADGTVATYRLPGDHRRILLDLAELDALIESGRRQVGVA